MKKSCDARVEQRRRSTDTRSRQKTPESNTAGALDECFQAFNNKDTLRDGSRTQTHEWNTRCNKENKTWNKNTTLNTRRKNQTQQQRQRRTDTMISHRLHPGLKLSWRYRCSSCCYSTAPVWSRWGARAAFEPVHSRLSTQGEVYRD